MKPITAPISMASGIARKAKLASVPPQARKAKAKTTAETETVPSMLRSIEPMMMMKVTPTATISAGVAATAMRAALRIEKKRLSSR